MYYYTRTEGKKPCYLILSVICTRRKNIGTEKEYVNDDAKHAPYLEDMELGFLKTANKHICEYHKDDSTPAQDADLGDIWSVENKVETYSDMDISDNDEYKDSREL